MKLQTHDQLQTRQKFSDAPLHFKSAPAIIVRCNFLKNDSHKLYQSRKESRRKTPLSEIGGYLAIEDPCKRRKKATEDQSNHPKKKEDFYIHG